MSNNIQNINRLAVFGAEPAFNEQLHVGRPNIGNRDVLLSRINQMLDGGWLTNNGPFVNEFEERIANYLGAKHCIAMGNGTIALEIAIRAMNLKGEVIVPSFTFIATAHALQWQEITPVFCDIEPQTHNLDPSSIEKMITPNTSAILGVHLWGRPVNIEAIESIAFANNLKILFDASHAFGNTYNGMMIGNFGNAEVFSFHATKFLNTFEGGAVVTNDDDLAEKIRLMKNFGFAGYDNVIYVGTNGKMSEVSAAMGLTGLDSLEEFILKNRENYYCYKEELYELQGVDVLTYDELEKNNFQYIILEIDELETGISRDYLLKVLHAENILARRYFYPGCHRMEPYKSYFPHAHFLLPITENLSNRVLSLPTGVNIGKTEIQKICKIIKYVVEKGSEITRKLRKKERRNYINNFEEFEFSPQEIK